MIKDNRCNQCILIVEDDPDVHLTLKECLEMEGYMTVSAYNGLEALRALREADESPCMILLDMMMPEMNGWEFLEKVKTDPKTESIPVVLASASRVDHDSLHSASVIQKPIRLNALLDSVEHFCGPA